jgi:phosphatidylglycerol:prolipoprotein diacylglycerol transferase
MHPILVKIGPIQLYTYGALLATAFMAGIYVAMRSAEKEGIKPEFIADMGILIILSAILGARLFYIVFYDLQNTLDNPRQLFTLQQTGLVFYGGLIFAVGAGVAFCRRRKVSVPVLMDVAAPSIALGQAIGRIGCFMSGCCYGSPTLAAWGVNFPHLDLARHPTQIYESLATFAIFLVLIFFRKRKTRVGQIMWLYVVMYATARFALEFVRGDNLPVAFGLTISQVVSLLALAAMVPLAYPLWFRGGARQPESGDGADPKGEKKN